MFNVKRGFIILHVFMGIVLQTGCASMNNSFDCPMKSGTRCESLDQVNAKIDRGEIGNDADGKVWKNSAIAWNAATIIAGSKNPLRHAETVQQIWVAPFEDSEGNYHAASSVYAVMQPGFWTHHAGVRRNA